MKRYAFHSSAVISIGYDVDLTVLEIEFVEGVAYLQSDVPMVTIDELLESGWRSRHIKRVVELEELRYARALGSSQPPEPADTDQRFRGLWRSHERRTGDVRLRKRALVS